MESILPLVIYDLAMRDMPLDLTLAEYPHLYLPELNRHFHQAIFGHRHGVGQIIPAVAATLHPLFGGLIPLAFCDFVSNAQDQTFRQPSIFKKLMRLEPQRLS